MTARVSCRGGCGRLLRSPVSVRRGYGPDCWRKFHPSRPRTPAVGELARPATASPRVVRGRITTLADLSTWTGTPLTGQTAIPIQTSIPMEET